MLIILIAIALAAAAAPFLVRSGRQKWAFPVLAAVPAAGLIGLIAIWPDAAHPRVETYAWIPALGVDIVFRLDTLAAVMAALVLGVGALILCYCGWYFGSNHGSKPVPGKPEQNNPGNRLGFFAAELTAFAAAMFGLVISDNMVVLYVFWELTSVLSFLLVGYYAERASARKAATQALLVTTLGGLAMLVGVLMLAQWADSLLLSDVLHHAEEHGTDGVYVAVAITLVLLGALSKSAIVPFHFWLPGAMAAPTPVSGYLHAAAMVKAGIFLIARLAPGFADVGAWQVLTLGLGSVSMLLAAWRASQEHDLKLILAFGTISQLGLLTVLMGVGDPTVAAAGLALLVAHALFKSSLFLTVGVIDHVTGTRDIRRLSGLGRRMPVLAVSATLAAASMAAIPPMIGFAAKESALTALLDTDLPNPFVGKLLAAAVALGAVLTVAYAIRFVVGAFSTKSGHPHQTIRETSAVAHAHFEGRLGAGLGFLAAPLLLAAAGLAGGLGAPWVGRVLAGYPDHAFGHAGDGASTGGGVSTGEAHHSELSLWHGFTPALGITAAVIVAGVLLASRHRWIRSLRGTRLGNADEVYEAMLRGADSASARTTRLTQRGSLPTSQAVILATFVLLPTGVLLWQFPRQADVDFGFSPLHAVIALLMTAAAIGATILRNRLAATLIVGVTGYGCAFLYAIYGAPDLALTQFLVETLTLVVFVLVLRKFPAEVDPRRRGSTSAGLVHLGRIGIAAATGVAVVIFGIVAVAARNQRENALATRLPGQAYDFGHGKNVVNVILVDIRAWDTMGEISVLLVAATGVASLVFRSRRFGAAPKVADANRETWSGAPVEADGQITWLRGSVLRDPRHRSLVLEVTTRIIFPLIMVVSVYFFFSGHNAPGGGFAGGLTAGLALVLRYLAGGRYEIGETLPLDAGKVLGAGLILSVGTALGSLAFGAPALSSAVFELTLPLLGEIKFVTAMCFDAGVYLIVLGLVLDVLRSLGARLDQDTSPALEVDETESTAGIGAGSDAGSDAGAVTAR